MASETKVNWREWSDEAFAEAKAQDKPVLLGISAVWCHWCHVMDRGVPGDRTHTGVYNNPQIADYINANFIPIRVDNDQRPDINARYNMGGWPTTCFLTPDGKVIYGGTYISPAQMRSILPQVVDVWRNNRDELLKQIGERGSADDDGRLTADDGLSSAVRRPSSLPEDAISDVVSTITRNFDPKNGGLGNGQKFPMSDAWELLLAVSSVTKEQRLLDMVTQTLVAMGTKGMYDLVAGGWFRYSTTPDWSVPHFEKMLEDHARLLPPYLHAIQVCRSEGRVEDGATLTKIVNASLGYLTSALLHDEDDVTYFAGSQDADEEYYMYSRDERATMHAPFIDWRLYADWNALMVSVLLQASVVLDQPSYADLAHRVWRTLQRSCINEDGSVRHSIIFSDGTANSSALRGQLGDQATLAKACLDLAQHFPAEAESFVAQAKQLIEYAMRELTALDGGFYDSPQTPDAQGLLRMRIKPIFDNATMAEALLAMYYLTDDGRSSKELAIETLAAFADEYQRYHEHGAPYALAVMRATNEPTEIMIVSQLADAIAFVRAAHMTYDSWRIVRVLDPESDADAKFIRERGYPVNKLPVAFVCRGMTCSAPVYTAEALQLHA